MAFRAEAAATVRFDEKLPLYGWLEDADFAAWVPGVLGRTNAFYGVHCGVKHGRDANARRFGYSQVSNPAYLWRKGSLPAGRALSLALRAIAANTAKPCAPRKAGREHGRPWRCAARAPDTVAHTRPLASSSGRPPGAAVRTQAARTRAGGHVVVVRYLISA